LRRKQTKFRGRALSNDEACIFIGRSISDVDRFA
jgi:hypothetical protein